MTRKTYFFEECSWFKFNNLGLALGMALKFCTSVWKELRVGKFRGLIPKFVSRSYIKSSKFSKTIVELMFTTQNANTCSLLDRLFCFVELFLDKFGPKTQIVSLSWNLVHRLIQICRISWWCSLFYLFDQKYLFWVNLVQKIKTVSLSWNLVPRLIWICRIQW